MPGGLGSNGGFHSDLNGECRHLSGWEMEGVFSVCVLPPPFLLPLLPAKYVLANTGE